jgi:hypothetical protein
LTKLPFAAAPGCCSRRMGYRIIGKSGGTVHSLTKGCNKNSRKNNVSNITSW